jgi:TDG/mug DNA glycosylase family protein
MEHESSQQLQGLPPVVNGGCRTLVLGSMPGAISISKQQYYGHPRNHFWPLLYAIFGGGKAPATAYAERTAFALSHGIALWDVLAACEREGSLDADIRRPEANAFAAFYAANPALERVFFNGKAAAQLYRKQVLPQLEAAGAGKAIRYCTLPSSSPAHTLPLEVKLEEWQKLQLA